jgi:hypothetical protein
MHEEVLTNLHNRLLASMRMPSLAGHGLPERMRSTAFAFLGLTAAAGLALVALFAQPTFSLLSPAPMPSDPSRANAVADAMAVASHPSLGDSVPAPRAGTGSSDGAREATSKPGSAGSDSAGAVAGGSPQPGASGGVSSPSAGAGSPAAPPQSSPPPAPAPVAEPPAEPAPAPAPEPAPSSQPRPETSASSTPQTSSPSPGRSTAVVSPTRGNSGAGASKGPPAHAASVRKSGTTAAPAPAPPAVPAASAAPAAAGGPPAHSAAGGNGNGNAFGHSK